MTKCMLDILELKLTNSRSTSVYFETIYCLDLRPQLSLVGLEKLSIDTNYGLSIDTLFSPSIDATTELLIDVPSRKLYVRV